MSRRRLTEIHPVLVQRLYRVGTAHVQITFQEKIVRALREPHGSTSEMDIIAKAVVQCTLRPKIS